MRVLNDPKAPKIHYGTFHMTGTESFNSGCKNTHKTCMTHQTAKRQLLYSENTLSSSQILHRAFPAGTCHFEAAALYFLQLHSKLLNDEYSHVDMGAFYSCGFSLSLGRHLLLHTTSLYIAMWAREQQAGITCPLSRHVLFLSVHRLICTMTVTLASTDSLQLQSQSASCTLSAGGSFHVLHHGLSVDLAALQD